MAIKPDEACGKGAPMVDHIRSSSLIRRLEAIFLMIEQSHWSIFFLNFPAPKNCSLPGQVDGEVAPEEEPAKKTEAPKTKRFGCWKRAVFFFSMEPLNTRFIW